MSKVSMNEVFLSGIVKNFRFYLTEEDPIGFPLLIDTEDEITFNKFHDETNEFTITGSLVYVKAKNAIHLYVKSFFPTSSLSN